MEFEKYQHVERFGTVETNGIEFGLCFIFPKIDGTNSQLWFEDGLQCGSRNRHLSISDDNAGFCQWANEQLSFSKFFAKHPSVRLYGEWLVPHTLKTYDDLAWRKFYVFDVVINGVYYTYDTYKDMLDEFGIDYIPPICKIENPTYERLIAQLENNTYLIKDGNGTGEGIVIKNYDYRNKYGRQTWAKIVRNDFKGQHQKCDVAQVKERKLIEELIVNRYVTQALVEKEFAKIDNESGWSSKQIPRLLNTVYYCLLKEESYNFVKEFKNPTVDFRRLSFLTSNRIKEIMPQLF